MPDSLSVAILLDYRLFLLTETIFKKAERYSLCVYVFLFTAPSFSVTCCSAVWSQRSSNESLSVCLPFRQISTISVMRLIARVQTVCQLSASVPAVLPWGLMVRPAWVSEGNGESG